MRDLHDPVGRPVRDAPLDGGRCRALDELIWRAVAVIGEEHPSVRREGSGHEGPEGPESLGGHVRQPEPHEDDVVPAVGFPGKQVGLDESHRDTTGDAARRDREHFRGRVDGGDATGMAEQLAGPGAGTAGELQDAARRAERVERVSQLGAAGKIEAPVKVVRGQGTVVGTLSGQKLVLN
jgi:hypothetical protein